MVLLYYAAPTLASGREANWLNDANDGRATVRVAMDGSFLALPPSGTGTYVRSLSAALRHVDPELSLTLLDPTWAASDASHTTTSRWPGADLWHRLLDDRRLRRFRWDLAGSSLAARHLRPAPDLLHIPHFAAPLFSPFPMVVTIHDVIPLQFPPYRASRAMRVQLAVMRRTVRRARLILTPSHAAAADIVQHLAIPAERIRMTPEAADSTYSPAPDPVAAREAVRHLGIDRRYIFNVGGLDVRKNLPVLLEAYARLLPRLNEPVQLVIAGAPHSANPYVFPPLAPIVERLGLAGKVVLTGRVSEEDKLALYRGADLYVTPSLAEGFGLTALEAMACGIPVIAANRTSLPEVVGEAGLLVEPAPEPLATAMLDLLSDPTRQTKLATAGLARAAEFTWEKTARLTMAAYEEAAAGCQ